jgi:hypothetical protein
MPLNSGQVVAFSMRTLRGRGLFLGDTPSHPILLETPLVVIAAFEVLVGLLKERTAFATREGGIQNDDGIAGTGQEEATRFEMSGEEVPKWLPWKTARQTETERERRLTGLAADLDEARSQGAEPAECQPPARPRPGSRAGGTYRAVNGQRVTTPHGSSRGLLARKLAVSSPCPCCHQCFAPRLDIAGRGAVPVQHQATDGTGGGEAVKHAGSERARGGGTNHTASRSAT